MSDLINRRTAVSVAEGCTFTSSYDRTRYMDFLHYCLDNTPTVDAVPVVHAKWIAQNDALTRFMCSHCKSENHEGFETYCPKCGALMDLRRKI